MLAFLVPQCLAQRRLHPLSHLSSCFFICLSSTEQAAGVYHRESRNGRYQLTYKEAIAVCKYEGGSVATYMQLEEARQIGLQQLPLQPTYYTQARTINYLLIV